MSVKNLFITPEEFDGSRLKLADFALVKNSTTNCSDAKITYMYKKVGEGGKVSDVEGLLNVLFRGLESSYSLSVNQQASGLNLKANVSEKNEQYFGDIDDENMSSTKDGFYKKLKLALYKLLLTNPLASEKKVFGNKPNSDVNKLYADTKGSVINIGLYTPEKEDAGPTVKYYEIVKGYDAGQKGEKLQDGATFKQKMDKVFDGKPFFTEFNILTGIDKNNKPIMKECKDVKKLTSKDFTDFNIIVSIPSIRYYGKKVLKLKENVKNVLIKDLKERNGGGFGADVMVQSEQLSPEEIEKINERSKTMNKLFEDGENNNANEGAEQEDDDLSSIILNNQL